MAVPVPQRLVTPEEYLTYERGASYKSEYIGGHIVAMSGVSREHSLINGNLSRVLGTQLLERPCEVHASDMRVKVSAEARGKGSRRGMYAYPDIAVVCGGAQFEDEQVDTLLNPTVIIEVLSPSTEAYDRGIKFGYYRQIASLREYLLVAQDHVQIEHFVREDDGWLLTETSDHDAIVTLPSIGCELSLTEVYRRITFPAEEGGPDTRLPGAARPGDSGT